MYSLLVVSGIFAFVIGLLGGGGKFITAGLVLLGCMLIEGNICLLAKSLLFVATVMTPIGILTGWK